MLFKSVEDLKKYLAGNQKNLSDATLMPFVEQAEIRYLIPVIGQEFYQQLNSAYNSPTTPGASLILAINRIQRALAYYTLADAIPFLSVAIGNAGIQETNTGNSTPVRQWTYNEIVTATSENADTFLDSALEFLENNAADYPVWKNSAAYTRSRELFINNARELSAFLPIGNSRRVYLVLRTFIARAEDLYIRPALGAALFEEMKAHVLAPATAAPAYRVILHRLIQKALAQLTLYLAIPSVQFVATAFGFKLQNQMLAAGNRLNADLADVDSIRQDAWKLAETYQTELKKYLDDNVTAIANYKAVFESQTRRRYELYDNANQPTFRV